MNRLGPVAVSGAQSVRASPPGNRNVGEVFAIFLKLGLTSFGGPLAHLRYFRREIVERRGWLSEAPYADIVGLCQFLPGPGSSQVGFSIGLLRAGLPGALAAWTGFTLPSALLMFCSRRSRPGFGTARNLGPSRSEACGDSDRDPGDHCDGADPHA
jgi:Chromate transporter